MRSIPTAYSAWSVSVSRDDPVEFHRLVREQLVEHGLPQERVTEGVAPPSSATRTPESAAARVAARAPSAVEPRCARQQGSRRPRADQRRDAHEVARVVIERREAREHQVAQRLGHPLRFRGRDQLLDEQRVARRRRVRCVRRRRPTRRRRAGSSAISAVVSSAKRFERDAVVGEPAELGDELPLGPRCPRRGTRRPTASGCVASWRRRGAAARGSRGRSSARRRSRARVARGAAMQATATRQRLRRADAGRRRPPPSSDSASASGGINRPSCARKRWRQVRRRPRAPTASRSHHSARSRARRPHPPRSPHGPRACPDAGRELFEQPGLADAGLAADQDQRASGRRHPLERGTKVDGARASRPISCGVRWRCHDPPL